MKNQNFIYDVTRSKYSRDFLQALLNLGLTPYFDQTTERIIFNGAYAIGWKDFEYGAFNFKMYIPSTGSAAVAFSFGLKEQASGRYALFNQLADATWIVSWSDGVYSGTQVIVVDPALLDTTTIFSINWRGQGIEFKLNELVAYTADISISEPMAPYFGDAGYGIGLALFEALNCQSIYEADRDSVDYLEETTLFDKAATITNGASPKVFVRDSGKDLSINLSAFNSPIMTVKIAVSDQDHVDFTQSASDTNRYTYVDLRSDDSDQSLSPYTLILGSTGIVITADLLMRFGLVNNGQKWLAAIVSGYTSGNLELTVSGNN
jgi:hypothetical protein